jgi:hypothetical protein
VNNRLFPLLTSIAVSVLVLVSWPAHLHADEEAGSRAEASELLEETLRSRGGIEEMGRLTEIHRQGELVIATPQGEVRRPLLITVRPPEHMVFETGEGEEWVRRELESGDGWESRGESERTALSGEETATLMRLVQVDEAFLAHAALAGDLEILGVEDAGPGQVDPALPAAAGRAILLRTSDGSNYRLVVPDGGGLPLRIDYRYTDSSGTDEQISDVFARWRIVDGLLFPAEVILYRDGQALTAGRYETITVKTEPSPAP